MISIGDEYCPRFYLNSAELVLSLVRTYVTYVSGKYTKT
jgi:hypothetical protein